MTARGHRVARWGEPQGRPRWAVDVDGDRSAVLLVRIWLEDGVESFRGRLTSMNTAPGERAAEQGTLAVASSPRDVVDAVRAWLDDFLRDAANPIDSDQ